MTKKIVTHHNTDNKGHLFVTVFEYTAFLYRDHHKSVPGLRTSAGNKALCNVTNTWLRCQLVPRHCTCAHL